MLMADLKMQLETSADEIKSIWTAMRAATGLTLPDKIYEHWVRKASLHHTLSATTGIFPAQEKAWEAIKVLKKFTSSPKEEEIRSNLVTYGGFNLDFAIARHLALTSYVVVSWSIYDRLANVCGRLAALSELSENPRQNPKACEDFLGKKDTLGFGTHLHIQQAYRWPLKVTYKIRNWLVHEGYEEGSIPLFQGDSIANAFILHEQAAQYLQRCCDYKEKDDGGIEACCLSGPEECWPARNLLDILKKYHAEIDTMFVGLVKWTVSSFIGQITAFAERDRTALTLGGVRK
jgi:hypothetical protein